MISPLEKGKASAQEYNYFVNGIHEFAADSRSRYETVIV